MSWFGNKRTWALAALTSALTAAAVAAPARADVEAHCTFEGAVNVSPAVPLVGGSGTYGFESLTFVCSAVENGSNAALVQLDITSSGTYDSGVCGTGTARSTNNTLNGVTVLAGTSTTDWNALVANLDYDIEFTGAQGRLTWRDGSGHETPGAVVELTRDPAGKPEFPNVVAGECTKGLRATGTGVLLSRTPECASEPDPPFKDTQVVKGISGKSTTFCDGALGVVGCARLEKWNEITKQWNRVEGMKCESGMGDTSPEATATAACQSGRYRTVGEGNGVYLDGGELVKRRAQEKKSGSVEINCNKVGP